MLDLTISPVQAALARARAQADGFDVWVRVTVLGANRLELPPESFDAVWGIGCSEHPVGQRRFIATCARRLRPGGVLALSAWLVTDDRRSAAQARLAAEVARGMPCPSLASPRKYLTWMRASGLGPIGAEDLTPWVKPTWAYGTVLIRRPAIRALLRVSDARLQRFAATFGLIHRAYAEGAMAYGMFTARKP